MKEIANFPGPCYPVQTLQKWLGRYEGNASPCWDLTLVRLGASSQACFHFEMRAVLPLREPTSLQSPPGSTAPTQAAPTPSTLSCPSPFSNVLAAALLLFCWLIPPSAQRLGPFSGRVPVSHCSQPRPQRSHCLWKSSQSFQTKVPRAG